MRMLIYRRDNMGDTLKYSAMHEQPTCRFKGACKSDGKEVCKTFCTRCFIDKLLHSESNLPENYKKDIAIKPSQIDVDSYKRLAYIRDNIKAWTQDGQQLFIYSNRCGNGKTTWATKLVREYFSQVSKNWHEEKAYFITMSEFSDTLKSAISNQDLEINLYNMKWKMENYALLVLDDVGSTRLSAYDKDTLFKVINTRISNGGAIICTANGNRESLEENLGPRLYSRLVESAEQIEFKGLDSRGGKKVWLNCK